MRNITYARDFITLQGSSFVNLLMPDNFTKVIGSHSGWLEPGSESDESPVSEFN